MKFVTGAPGKTLNDIPKTGSYQQLHGTGERVDSSIPEQTPDISTPKGPLKGAVKVNSPVELITPLTIPDTETFCVPPTIIYLAEVINISTFPGQEGGPTSISYLPEDTELTDGPVSDWYGGRGDRFALVESLDP
jgi:hypothetical protein